PNYRASAVEYRRRARRADVHRCLNRQYGLGRTLTVKAMPIALCRKAKIQTFISYLTERLNVDGANLALEGSRSCARRASTPPYSVRIRDSARVRRQAHARYVRRRWLMSAVTRPQRSDSVASARYKRYTPNFRRRPLARIKL